MISSLFRKSSLRCFSGVVGLGIALVAVTSLTGQETKSKTQPPKKVIEKTKPSQDDKPEYRYSPSMAVVMVAYEGYLKNDEQTNPEAVKAMKKAFAEHPKARAMFDKMYKNYRALSATNREKLVGKELVQSTSSTQLTKAMVEPIFKKHFSQKSMIRSDKLSGAVKATQMKPVLVDDKEMLLDSKTKLADKLPKLSERMVGKEPKEGSSTTYRVDYTGLYCVQEPADFGFHCEPCVLFVMHQGGTTWIKRKGPYDHCDSGDSYHERTWLRSRTTFNNDLVIIAMLLENDIGDIEEMEDTLLAIIDVAAIGLHVGNWSAVPDWLEGTIDDVMEWYIAVFGFDHDRIGPIQGIILDRRYAERHTRHLTWEGFEYDTWVRFRGNMDGPRRQRGDFYVFLDVREFSD